MIKKLVFDRLMLVILTVVLTVLLSAADYYIATKVDAPAIITIAILMLPTTFSLIIGSVLFSEMDTIDEKIELLEKKFEEKQEGKEQDS